MPCDSCLTKLYTFRRRGHQGSVVAPELEVDVPHQAVYLLKIRLNAGSVLKGKFLGHGLQNEPISFPFRCSCVGGFDEVGALIYYLWRVMAACFEAHFF